MQEVAFAILMTLGLKFIVVYLRTKEWLENNLENIFGYPTAVRFSWGTLEPLLEKAVTVKWSNGVN